MNFRSTNISLAKELDSKDELKSFRKKFFIEDPNLIYLDGNSLGRLPQKTIDEMKNVIEHQWGARLIRGWNETWIDKPSRVSEKISKIVGARADEIVLGDSTSVNLFKLISAALKAKPQKTKIVSDEFNFPSDLYVIQGVIELFGNEHKLELIESKDAVTIDPEEVKRKITDDTAIVILSHVAFKSSFMYDMQAVTETVHKAGALILWDLSHAAGAVPIELSKCNADLAVGCTYKYLNGGPGSPAFLYVRKDLQIEIVSPVWGWFGSNNPFSFNLNYTPARGIQKFMVGTPSILSLSAVEPALDILLEAGINRIRKKSIEQTEYILYLTCEWLKPLGFEIGSPADSRIRGSHVSICHQEGYRICKAMIESPPPAIRVIPDFRTPDNIRLGVAPLYTSFEDIYLAMERIKVITEGKIFEQYPKEISKVT